MATVVTGATSVRMQSVFSMVNVSHSALILTSHPRVLCVPRDPKHEVHKPSDVKKSFLLLGHNSGVPAKGEKQPILIAHRVNEAQKKLIFKTASKPLTKCSSYAVLIGRSR